MRFETDWLLTAQAMRRADQATIEAGTPGHLLMERAGKAVANEAARLHPAGRVVIVCGPGNNGGDGLAAACFLHRQGIRCCCVLLTEETALRGDAAHWLGKAKEAGVKIRQSSKDLSELSRWIDRSALLIDAIFGTGLARMLAGHWQKAVQMLSSSRRPVLAVDLPSGICADTGKVLGAAVQASRTLPIAAYKRGHWLFPGRHYCGRISAPASIGIREETIERAADPACAQLVSKKALFQAFPPRPLDAHKGFFGRVGIVGGARGTLGAPVLASYGALSAGAGLVHLFCDEALCAEIAGAHPVLMIAPMDDARLSACDVLVIGCGWGVNDERIERLGELLALPVPCVIDADALRLIARDAGLQARLAERPSPSVLTPHPKEAALLLGEEDARAVNDARIEVARELARKFNAYLVLKGAATVVAAPSGEAVVSAYAVPRLAQGGTGDVLAGAIGALLARRDQQLTPMEAAVAGVLLHAEAATQDEFGTLASLLDAMSKLRMQIESGRQTS